MPLAKIDPRLPDIAVAVAAADRVDDTLDAVDHLRPIHLGVLDRDPEPAGGAGFMKRVSGANKRLRGIAAGVEAGAAHFPLLDHGDACALATCFGCGGAPGGASADDDQIVWCAGAASHRNSLLQGRSSRIFDRFERVETGIAGRIAGAGLGLSIVQEIAGLHGAGSGLTATSGSDRRFTGPSPLV